MRILVTGVTGQVGGAIVKTLSSRKTVVAADRQVMDLAQPNRIAAVLDQIHPDLIINPAAYTAVDRAEDEPELAFQVNAQGPQVIAAWAADHRIPLIHFSTDYVFDGSGTRSWREDDHARPLSVYGASKLAGEQAVQSAGGPHLIVRTSWVYDAAGSNFLRTIGRLTLERRSLRVVADQIGAPTSARLIAEVISKIVIENGATTISRLFTRANGVVSLAASGETSWHGFATAIVSGLKMRGVPIVTEEIIAIETRDYPTKAKRPANSRLDLARLRSVFGVVTPAWEQTLPGELDRLADALIVRAG